jgi:cell division protein FtsL
MTPPASATAPHTARPTRRRPAQRPPRRVSGPAARRTRVAPPRAAGGAVAVAPPLALRLTRAGGRIVDARFLDRLLRGRVWIALLALGLMGIVFIQVSMLQLNAGISRAITSAETLHRQNATLRADLSKLDSSERIADAAKSFGMIQPAAGSVNYLDARKANGAAAARGIHRPKPPKTAPTTAATTTATAATAATATTTPAPTATTTPAPVVQPQTTATTTPAPTTTQAQAATTPAPQTTAPAQQQAAPVEQQAAPAEQQTAPVEQQPQTQIQPQAAVTPAGGVTATGQGGQ